MMIIKTIYKLHPRVSCDEYLHELEKKLISESSRDTDGNLMYEFFLSPDDIRSVILMSVWEKKDDYLNYKATDGFLTLSGIEKRMVREKEVIALEEEASC